MIVKSEQNRIELVTGPDYDKDCGTASDRMKKSFWSEDMEDTLTRVFQQFKGGENQTTEEGQDILDAITAHFVESNKSRRQVAAKLKAMGLIQNTKEITRKPIRSKVQWSEEETEALTRSGHSLNFFLFPFLVKNLRFA